MLTKRKATKKGLDELRKIMPVLSEIQQRGYVGRYACNNAMGIIPTVPIEGISPFGAQQIQPMMSISGSGSYIGCENYSVSYSTFRIMKDMEGNWPGGWVDGMGFVSAAGNTYRQSCVFHVFAQLAGTSTQHFFNIANGLGLHPCTNGGVTRTEQDLRNIAMGGGFRLSSFCMQSSSPVSGNFIMEIPSSTAGLNHLVIFNGVDSNGNILYSDPANNRSGSISRSEIIASFGVLMPGQF